MSCILGIVRFDGQSVAPASLAAMRDALAYWGRDAARLWHDGPAGLGQLVSFTTPESPQEKLPRADASTGQAFTATGRLDHRDGLCEALGLSQPERVELADGDLMESAWRKWGEECVHHLRGDWTFAAWNARERRLFLAQTAYGVTSLFYHATPGAFFFATGIKALLALPEIPRQPDFQRVGQILACWPSDGSQSGYVGIRRLPPANTLTVQDGQVQVRRYWFPEDAPALHFARDDDYADGLLEVFTRAIRSRLRGSGTVGATLSGGLDSGAVCAVAARELRSAGKRLPTFTSVPLHHVEYARSGSFADESPYVRAACEHFGNADPHFINAKELSPLAGLRRVLELTDEPGHAACNFYWIVAILTRARELGVSTLLNGQAGNGTISYTGQPANGWNCLAQGDWRSLAVNWPCGPEELWPAFKRHWLVPVWRPVRTWLATRHQPEQVNWAAFSAIRPEFVESIRLLEQMRESGHDLAVNRPGYLFTSRRRERLATLQLGGNSSGGYLWTAMVAGSGVEVRDPTFDEAVMEYCLRVPDEVYCRRGRYRSLIRRAMKGLLPDVVRLNEKRGKQAEDLAYRIRATKGEWVEALAGLEQSALAREALDLPRMRRLLDSLDAGITREKTDQCMMVLTRGLMAGEFLKRFN